MNESSVCLTVFIVIFFIIGLPTLLLGCNPNLDNQCIAYDVVKGTVYDHSFIEKTCQSCNFRGRGGTCYSYDYWTCYSAYVKFHHGNNETCTYQTADEKKSKSDALDSLLKYDVGDKKTMIKRKDSKTCSNLSGQLMVWEVGVTFLSLCGFAVLLLIGCEVRECVTNWHRGAPLSALSNNAAQVRPMQPVMP